MSILKSESLAKLAPALVKAQKSMGAALKDSKNPFFKSKYADLNAIIDAAIPALNAEGIAVLQTPEVVYGTDKMVPVIQTVLLHESGEFIAGRSEIVAAKSNDPQAAGSATTYARRYGLQAMVTLKAEDDDDEQAMGRKPIAAEKTSTSKASSSEDLKKEAAEASVSSEAPAKKGGFLKTKKAAAKPAETTESGDLF